MIDTDLKQAPYGVAIAAAPNVISFNAYGLANGDYDVTVQHANGTRYRVAVAANTRRVEVFHDP